VKESRPVVFVAICLAVGFGCQRPGESGPAKSAAPAKVAQSADEEDLGTITLTPKADERLGIRTVPLESVEIQAKRTLGGEVVVPPGQTIEVSAPLAGTLMVPEGGVAPSPGSLVTVGQPVFRLAPLLTPERDVLTPAERVHVARAKADIATAQIEAARQIESAEVDVEAAQIAYDRAVQLLGDKAGSQRSVDEAQARLKLAREALTTAQARHELLARIRLDEEAGELNCRDIMAPITGVLQSIEAMPGATVPAGARLFRVVKLDPLWIRVPVYVGHRREIDTDSDALVAEYGQSADVPPSRGKYVTAPPSANPDASTIDLFYELSNDDARWYPGQRLAVTIPLQTREKRLVAPYSAVIYDIHGGAWVYEQIAPQTFVRRRVEVQYVDGAKAILSAGPEPGAKLVVEGAAELFGTEFGFGK
jgi:RND family efflux transporter MFP subunit